MEQNEQTGSDVPYAALFNEMPDAILVVDQGGRIKDSNMRAIELLGYKTDELRALHVTGILTSSHENQLEIALAELDKKRFYSYEAYCTRRDCLQFLADIMVARISFGSDSNLYFFIRDATQRKMLEEQVRNANKIRSLHMLAGSVAHDFNNMLTSIVGHIELAMPTISARSRASDDLTIALKDAKRMAELSLRMLEYSGKGLLAKSTVNLATILTGAADKLVQRIPHHVIMKIPPSSARTLVHGEKDLLETAVTNILLNALEAVEKTGGSVTAYCSTENVDPDALVSTYTNSELAPGEYSCLTVSDSGYGMDNIILGKIFEPFFSTKGSGRGLGLSETQGIVLSHGGTIAITTLSGHGTTLKLFFPAIKETAKKLQVPVPARPVTQERHTILIIDDDPSVRRYAGRIIQKLGYASLVAEDGEDGINQFRMHADEIDLVIVDMFMPRLNGDEVLRNIRKMRPAIKVLIISGYTETIFMDKFKDEQPSGFLYKPFVTGDFVDKINQILKQ